MFGHAVRALYLLCGVVDVVVETGDDELLDVERPVGAHGRAARTYLTGGWARGTPRGVRRRLRTAARPRVRRDLRRRRHGDVRAGGCCSRPARPVRRPRRAHALQRGRDRARARRQRFFYNNPLHQRPGEAPPARPTSARAGDGPRASWFHVACCPPNIGATLARSAGYVATGSDGGVQIHQLCRGRSRRPGRVLGVRDGLPVVGRGHRPGGVWTVGTWGGGWGSGCREWGPSRCASGREEPEPVAPG